LNHHLWLLLELTLHTQILNDNSHDAYDTLENFIYNRVMIMNTYERNIAFDRIWKILERLND
jgi:hypothetical protein